MLSTGPFTRLTGSLVTGPAFTDPSAPAGANELVLQAFEIQADAPPEQHELIDRLFRKAIDARLEKL